MISIRLAVFALAMCTCTASAQERPDMAASAFPDLAGIPLASGDRAAGEAGSPRGNVPAESYIVHEGRRYLVRQANIQSEGSGPGMLVHVAEPLPADFGRERIVPVPSLLDRNRSPSRR